MEGELYSTCCGAEAGEYEDVGICPQCLEHTEFKEEQDDGKDAL